MRLAGRCPWGWVLSALLVLVMAGCDRQVSSNPVWDGDYGDLPAGEEDEGPQSETPEDWDGQEEPAEEPAEQAGDAEDDMLADDEGDNTGDTEGDGDTTDPGEEPSDTADDDTGDDDPEPEFEPDREPDMDPEPDFTEETVTGLRIWDIQNTASPLHPSQGSEVFVAGVVVVCDPVYLSATLRGVFLSETVADAYTGIFMVYEPSVAPAGMGRGSLVHVSGAYVEYYGNSEIEASDITLAGTTTLPAPMEVYDPAAIADSGSEAEAFEGVLVCMHGVTVTADDLGYDEVLLNDVLTMDDQLYDYPMPSVGTTYTRACGVMTYTYGVRKLLPRDEDDLMESAQDGDIETETEADRPDMAEEAAETDGGSASPIAVATFNVQMFFDTTCDSGACGASDFEQQPTAAQYQQKVAALASALEDLDADVVLLQEVETLDCLLEVTDTMAGIYPVAVLGETGYAGSVDVGVVSRGVLLDVVTHQDTPIALPGGGYTTFTREFLEVHLQVDGARVIVFSAHFKSKASDNPDRRLAEAMAAHDIVVSVADAFPQALVIMGGDLNDLPGSDPLNALTSDGLLERVASDLPENQQGTYWYGGVMEAIDHLLLAADAAGSYISGSAQVVSSDGLYYLEPSDHAGLRAVFYLP